MTELVFWLDDGAYMPTRGHVSDAGLDLRTPDEFTVFSEDSHVVDTGVHLVIPDGYAGLIVAKSGLNVNHGIEVTGLVDAGFTGSIKVRVYNHTDEYYDFDAGDKIAQIMIVPVPQTCLLLREVQNFNARGDDGYGSTGR